MSTTPPSSDRPVMGVTAWSPLFSAMRAVHTTLGAKAAEQLAEITKSDPRTVKRFFAPGHTNRVPNGNAVYAMVRHPSVGPAFIVQATRNLPPIERREFWIRMIGAAHAALEKDIGL